MGVALGALEFRGRTCQGRGPVREPPGRGFLSLPALWDCHSEAPGSSAPSPALTPHPPGVFCCICLPAALLSTSPVTLLPNPVFSPPRLCGLGVGMGLSW